jgi:hypothetical protein
MNNWSWTKFTIGLAIGIAVGPWICAFLCHAYDSLCKRINAFRQNEAKFK